MGSTMGIFLLIFSSLAGLKLAKKKMGLQTMLSAREYQSCLSAARGHYYWPFEVMTPQECIY
jgi:UPF0716 family protein affecting phage T7 exclusion